jgi:ATP/maltotriose-dependent transcriptional regulator MalT
MRLGRWDEALSWASEIPSPEDVPSAAFPTVWVLPVPIMIAARRGEIERAESLLDARLALPQALADSQNRADSACIRATVRRASGRFREAMDAALEAMAIKEEAGAMAWSVQWGTVESMEAALALGDLATLEQLLAEVVSGPGREVTPSLRAETERLSARLSVARGDLPAAEPRFRSAIQQLRKIDDPFVLAEPLAELAECLISQGRVAEAEPFLAEARDIFERLGARPWLERIEGIEAKVPKVASGV